MGDEFAVLPDGVEITDGASVASYLHPYEPDVVYHLAGIAQVGRSWEAPQETFRVNASGTLEILEVVRGLERAPRVVLVSSAEVYGHGDASALTEDAPLLPVTPYAASKVAAEYLGVQAHLGHGLEVVRARPFNHVGPGQHETFVVSALARRIVEAERAGTKEIRVGNLDTMRDFTDVRDVVRAYRLLALHGETGRAYNVCSGTSVSIASVLEELVGLAHGSVRAVIDASLLRPADVASLRGDASALFALTGWRPEIPLATTLADVLSEWRARLSDAAARR
jgi:GDP-4-dehydro-6-deoxy-D-mannose reductase